MKPKNRNKRLPPPRAGNKRPAPSRRRDTKPAAREPGQIPDGMLPSHYQVILTWLSNGYNARKAYQEHYPECGHAAAAVCAHRVLTTDKARAFIREYLEAELGPLEATAAETKARLGAASRFDPADIFDEKNKLRPVKDWPLSARLALKSIDGDKVTFESRVGVWRVVLELEGKLKSPAGEVADVVTEALKATMENARKAREAKR